MMLPSSTYANTSALCRWAGTTSPGERRTVSIRPSFPGTSGRVFVIRDVSFAIWRFALLEACDWNSTNARMNNENTCILLIYKLLIRSRGSEAAADVLFEFVELAPPLQATLCHFDQDCSNRTSVPADVGISALFDNCTGQIDKSNPILVLCVQRDRSSRRPSTLNGNLSHPARSKAPPAAEKTEKSKGAFAPNASAIDNPNAIRRIPLNRAALRVCQPTRRRSPKRISAPVELTASVRVILGGKYELSRPVYSTKREKFPQATFGCPNCPHRPNLSATAERNERPSANRKNTELKLPHLLIAKGKTVCSKCFNEGRCEAGDKGVFIFIDRLLLTVNRLRTSVARPSRHHPSCTKAISNGTP